MEWFVLLVAVPLILVPVVLLWGFSGCSFEHGILPWNQPTNVTAIGISTNEIRLTWDPGADNVPGVMYEIEVGNGNVYQPLTTQSGVTYTHSSLEQGTAYFYRVRVMKDLGQDRGNSDWSEAEGRTRAVAFEKALTTDQSGIQGMCLVQRFNNLQFPGTQLWITLRSADTGPLRLDAISFRERLNRRQEILTTLLWTSRRSPRTWFSIQASPSRWPSRMTYIRTDPCFSPLM